MKVSGTGEMLHSKWGLVIKWGGPSTIRHILFLNVHHNNPVTPIQPFGCVYLKTSSSAGWGSLCQWPPIHMWVELFRSRQNVASKATPVWPVVAQSKWNRQTFFTLWWCYGELLMRTEQGLPACLSAGVVSCYSFFSFTFNTSFKMYSSFRSACYIRF